MLNKSPRKQALPSSINPMSKAELVVDLNEQHEESLSGGVLDPFTKIVVKPEPVSSRLPIIVMNW